MNDASSNLNEVANKLRLSTKPAHKETIKINENVEYILFDKIDEITHPLKANLKKDSTNSSELVSSSNNNKNTLLQKSDKLNLKYQTLSINPRKNNFPELAQNTKKFYSVNKAKAVNNYANHAKEEAANSNLDNGKQLHTSESKEKPLTEEIEKEANFLVSSNESDCSESTNKISDLDTKKLYKSANQQKQPSGVGTNPAVATAKIINMYPNSPQNVASVRLSQHTAANSVSPYKHLDLKNPLVPVKNIKLSPKVLENDPLYAKVLKEKSPPPQLDSSSIKTRKFLSKLYNKSLLSSSSSSSTTTSNANNSSFKSTDLNIISEASDFPASQKAADTNPYISSSKTPASLNEPALDSNKNAKLICSTPKSEHNAKVLLAKKSSVETNNNANPLTVYSPVLVEEEKQALKQSPIDNKNRVSLKARDINLNLRDLNFSDETLKKIEKVMERHHLKQLNLYVNTDEAETSSKANLDSSTSVANSNNTTNTRYIVFYI